MPNPTSFSTSNFQVLQTQRRIDRGTAPNDMCQKLQPGFRSVWCCGCLGSISKNPSGDNSTNSPEWLRKMNMTESDIYQKENRPNFRGQLPALPESCVHGTTLELQNRKCTGPAETSMGVFFPSQIQPKGSLRFVGSH